MEKKTFSCFTFGCKVNQYETQVIREQLQKSGFKEDSHNPACYIINGCIVTGNAQKKCRFLIRSLQKKTPRAQIIITGCYSYKLDESNSALFLENKSIKLIPHDKKFTIAAVLSGRRYLGINKGLDSKITDFKQHSRAFVKIQDGCDNFCSYCIVPHVRGKSRSKKEAVVLREIKDLAAKGFKEIVLTGINLGMWGKDFKSPKNLAFLVEKICNIRELIRLRLSSIELQCIDERLIALFGKKNSKLCAHLHIPLQSGDSGILKSMNRHYDKIKFLEKIKKIKEKVKGIGLSTDVLVGFPGESDAAFNNTQDVIKAAEFLKVHIFPYSSRPGTKAAKSMDQIAPSVKNLRKKILEKLVENVSLKYRKKMKGETVEVLFEEKDQEDWLGYCREYVQISVKTRKNLKNTLQKVKIIKVASSHTRGVLLK